MSLPKYQHFKFEIGQFVLPVIFTAMKLTEEKKVTESLHIVERIYQECPGGVQLNYICRPQYPFLKTAEFIKYNEIELASFDEVPELEKK